MKKMILCGLMLLVSTSSFASHLMGTRVNLYGTPEVFTAHKWYGRWVDEHGNDLQWKPYAWAKYPKPATRPKTKKG